jgi:pyruvate dehydrogenase E2 component (dihydrolipoamide acetyltransferase)
MPIEILMPALSPTMTEGNLAKWHKKEGDEVKSGDVIAEIETDKATMEVEAVDEGRLGKILVPEGAQGVKVNQPIALLLGEGESAGAAEKAPSAGGGEKPAEKKAAPAEPQPAAKAQAPAPAAKPEAQPQARPVGGNGAAAPQPQKPAPAAGGEGERVFASPLARRMAAQAGIELSALKGSGPHGRVVKSDIEAAVAAGPVAKAPAKAPAGTPAQAPAAPQPGGADTFGLPPFKEVPHSTMRKTIARRLTEGVRDLPYFFLSIDCEIDALMKIRQELNGKSDKYKLSVNDFVIRAVALAMKKEPALNASWTDSAMRQYERVDVSVAVAIPAGLTTPVVRGADSKGLAEISNEVRELAERARAGKLKPEEYSGGSISVSNLGMFGIPSFTAVINPPQSAILAVGAGEQRPIVREGALAVATMMSCTLTVDHRVADGATAAKFLTAFKKLIEDPLQMLL